MNTVYTGRSGTHWCDRGLAVVFGIEFVDQKLKVDDPVGAVGVHGICGCLGTILTGLFAYYDFGNGEKLGLFYGGGIHFLGLQILGVVAVIAWVAVTDDDYLQCIKAYDRTSGFGSGGDRRTGYSRARTRVGLCGLCTYLQHQQLSGSGTTAIPTELPKKAVPVDDAVPVQVRSETAKATIRGT